MIAVRTITFGGNLYLRAEDVAEYIRELAGSEETDTRYRMELAAAYIDVLRQDRTAVSRQSGHPD